MIDRTPCIWTVGHSNHELEGFARLVSGEKIDYLVDVRSFPYSRFAPQFNREDLEAEVGARGIRYVYLGEALGGRPTREEHYDADGHALYGPMSEEPRFQEAVDRLIGGARSDRIALVCSEGDPRDCHRRLLVGRALCERGVELRHIMPDGTVASERSVDPGGQIAQAALFREEAQWRSTRSVSHRRRLSTSSDA